MSGCRILLICKICNNIDERRNKYFYRYEIIPHAWLCRLGDHDVFPALLDCSDSGTVRSHLLINDRQGLAIMCSIR